MVNRKWHQPVEFCEEYHGFDPVHLIIFQTDTQANTMATIAQQQFPVFTSKTYSHPQSESSC